MGLNPYSNGMMIEPAFAAAEYEFVCLNPYSNGMKIERSDEGR